MCKIVAFTNSKKLDVKKTVETIGAILLKLERDGYGYAIQGEQNVFGERCVAGRFVSRLNSSNVVQLPIIESRQTTFGSTDKPTGPAIFHGRTSTNDKGLLNCHPMTKNDWHLIHNGVVDDHGPKYEKLTTNDSEDLLHRLILGIEHVERELAGYYAFCAIDPSGRLHVARDSMASLYMAWCPVIQSFILATTESLIEDVTKKLKIKVGPIDKVKTNCYVIFQGNDLVLNQELNPRGYDKRQTALAELSLGQVIDASSYERFEDVTDDGESIDDLMRELESMDASYTIIDDEGNELSVTAYNKLDEVGKLQCDIWRPDGTILDIPESRWNR